MSIARQTHRRDVAVRAFAVSRLEITEIDTRTASWRHFESPEGWKCCKLAECAEQRTEKVLPDAGDDRRYVALEHLAQGSPRVLGWLPAWRALSAKTVFREGDVLFAKLRPNLRKAAAAPFDGLCSTDILPIFGKGDLETSYLLQLAQSSEFSRHAIATASGTKMPRTSWRQLSELVVKLPPKPEQRQIAAILSAVDEAIERSQEVVRQLRVVKRGLTQELIERADGRESRWTELGNVVDLRLSGVDKRTRLGEKTVRLCNYRDVYNNESILDSMAFMEATATEREINSCRLRMGDVVITKDSETPTDIGVPAFVRGPVTDLICGYHLAILRPLESVLDGDYLYHALCSEETKRQFQMYANGITRFGLRAGDIKRVRIRLLDLSDQRRVAATLSSVEGAIEKRKAELPHLDSLKRALRSTLLTGELRVTSAQATCTRDLEHRASPGKGR